MATEVDKLKNNTSGELEEKIAAYLGAVAIKLFERNKRPFPLSDLVNFGISLINSKSSPLYTAYTSLTTEEMLGIAANRGTIVCIEKNKIGIVKHLYGYKIPMSKSIEAKQESGYTQYCLPAITREEFKEKYGMSPEDLLSNTVTVGRFAESYQKLLKIHSQK